MRSATPRALGAAAVLTLALGALPAAAARQVVEDDYPRALALAKDRGVPILVDVWAPW
jgi:hypothetical protein